MTTTDQVVAIAHLEDKAEHGTMRPEDRKDLEHVLAVVREQRARLDALLALCDTAEKYGVYHVIQAATVRAAITATEGAE